jgi:hypothetical protein
MCGSEVSFYWSIGTNNLNISEGQPEAVGRRRTDKIQWHQEKVQNKQNNQNIDNSECFGVKFVKIYPEMTSQ